MLRGSDLVKCERCPSRITMRGALWGDASKHHVHFGDGLSLAHSAVLSLSAFCCGDVWWWQVEHLYLSSRCPPRPPFPAFLLPLQKLSCDSFGRVLDSVSSTFEHLSRQFVCLTITWHMHVLFARRTHFFLFDGTPLLIEKKSAGLQVSNEKCVISIFNLCLPQA